MSYMMDSSYYQSRYKKEDYGFVAGLAAMTAVSHSFPYIAKYLPPKMHNISDSFSSSQKNAINNAISNGERKFKALYLMTSSDEICYPCNLCKQTFLEFFDNDVIFNVMTSSGKMEVLTFAKIMNTTFTKEDLV